MRELSFGLALIMTAACWGGCDADDISVCELPESLNTCEGDDDCLLVYCGVECCPCERVASRRQLDETYCMDDRFDFAREACEEARQQVCEGVSCIDNPCPHFAGARCEGGICVAAY